MKYTKKFTIVKKQTLKDESYAFPRLDLKLTYGPIEGPHYSQEYPEELFDSEEEAIEYAFNKDIYAEWLVIPVIKFDKT